MLVAAIVNESVLLLNRALGSIKLTSEKYYACARFRQYKIATHNQTSYSISESLFPNYDPIRQVQENLHLRKIT